MVMTVQCPSCASTFPVDPAKVPAGGVNARCTVCSQVFRVERPAPPDADEGRERGGTAAAAAGGAAVAGDPARAATPGEPPATQADTESRVEVPEPHVEPSPHRDERDPETDAPEAEVERARGVGGEAAPGAEDPAPSPAEERADDTPRVTASAPLTGGGGDGGWGTGDADAGIATTAGEASGDPAPGGEAERPAAGADTEEEAAADDWVFETEDDLPGDFAAVETAGEGGPEEPRREEGWQEGVFEIDTGEAETTTDAAAPTVPGAPHGGKAAPGGFDVVDEDEPEVATPAAEAAAASSGEVAPEAASPAEPIQAFSFGQRDPADKARRLARVLVSDMIMYNPERHHRALENGTLKEDFEEEMEKSWKEYVEQVGEEMARGTDYWRNALNDILAKGEELF